VRERPEQVRLPGRELGPAQVPVGLVLGEPVQARELVPESERMLLELPRLAGMPLVWDQKRELELPAELGRVPERVPANW
jgi:hypothetical protein